MTKEQKRIYNWLMKRPGYLKKSVDTLINNIDGDVDYNDAIIALKEARIVHRNKFIPKDRIEKEIVVKENKELIKLGKKVCKTQTLKCYTPKLIRPSLDVNNVLAISDLHEPFCKTGYLEHCISIRDKYNCGTIVLIGDEVDLCGVSQWEKDPDGFSAGSEAELAQSKMEVWYKIFPTAFVCIGNHTARPFRQAKANGIPKKFLKTYEEAWKAPKTWKWAESWEFNGVFYTHGTGFSGANAAIRIATRHRQNTVIGHIHSEAGIQYSASKIDLVWGMQLGGALDDKSYAAFYAKEQLKKSIVGCGVVLNGILPIYEPMIL